MDEERRLILSLVEQGKITPEEAAALLQALDEDGLGEGDAPAPTDDAAPGSQGPRADSGDRPSEGRPSEEERGQGQFGGIPGFDPDQLGRIVEDVMGRLGDELRHLPEQFSRLGFALGGRERVRTSAKRVWQSGEGPVVIENANGDITVEAWDRAEVGVEADIRLAGPLDDSTRHWLEGEGLRLEEKANGLRVLARDPSRTRTGGARLSGADMHVQVPAGTAVRITAARGDITLLGDLGAITVDTASGDIEVRGGKDSVHLASRSGDITVTGIEVQHLEVSSTSGDLKAVGTAGAAFLRAVSGDISAELADCREVRASSVSGDIQAQLGLTAGASCESRSTSGDISLRLGVSLTEGLTVNLESLSGDLNCLLPLDRVEKSKRQLTGARGDGSIRISAKSLSGDVTIR